MTAPVFRTDGELHNPVTWFYRPLDQDRTAPLVACISSCRWQTVGFPDHRSNGGQLPSLSITHSSVSLALWVLPPPLTLSVSICVSGSVLVFASIPVFLSLCTAGPILLSLSCISVCPYFCLISPLTLFLSLTPSLLSLSTYLCLFYQWTLAITAWLKVWKILDLNESVPIASTFEHFSPVGSTVWGGLGGSALLEKVCYWW